MSVQCGQCFDNHLWVVKAEGGDVRVEGDGDQVEGGGGAGYPQLGVVAPAKLFKIVPKLHFHFLLRAGC